MAARRDAWVAKPIGTDGAVELHSVSHGCEEEIDELRPKAQKLVSLPFTFLGCL